MAAAWQRRQRTPHTGPAVRPALQRAVQVSATTNSIQFRALSPLPPEQPGGAKRSSPTTDSLRAAVRCAQHARPAAEEAHFSFTEKKTGAPGLPALTTPNPP